MTEATRYVPFVPAEEGKVFELLLQLLKSIKQNVKQSAVSLASLKSYEDQVKDIADEVATVRVAFKREDSSAKTPTDVLLAQVEELISGEMNTLFQKLDPSLTGLYQHLNDVYVKLSKWKETGAFLYESHVLPVQQELGNIENSHSQGGVFYSAQDESKIPSGQAIISQKLNSCYRLVRLLTLQSEAIDSALEPILTRLVVIYDDLDRMLNVENATSYSNKQILEYQKDLRSIDLTRHHSADEGGVPGAFVTTDGKIPSGQAFVVELLETCFSLTHQLLARRDPVEGSFRPVYEQLIVLKRELEEIFETRYLWLHSAESAEQKLERLRAIQSELHSIDEKRTYGKFITAGPQSKGQAVLHFLIHKCHRLAYKTLVEMSFIAPEVNAADMSCAGEYTIHHGPGRSREAMSIGIDVSLIPIHTKLLSIRRCLMELLKHAPWNESDLVMWRLRLKQIDDKRVRGLFLSDSKDIPTGAYVNVLNEGEVHNVPLTGQAILSALWNENFELLNEMEMEAEHTEPYDSTEEDGRRLHKYKPLNVQSFY